MAKQHRGRARTPFAISSGATITLPSTTQTPLFIFGTATPLWQLDAANTLPQLPQDVINKIIDHLYDKPVDLRVSSLVAKGWKARSQSHLFRQVFWTPETVLGWCQHIPPRSDGLAGYTTSLEVISVLEWEILAPIKEYFTSFRNVTSLTLRDLDFDDPVFDPNKVPAYFGHLKPGLTSLTLINASGSCGRLVSFASFFPRLDHITISCPGELVPPDPTIDLEYRPLRGTLFLRGHLNRHTNLVKLLSRASLSQWHTVRLEHWGKMHVEDLNSLLASCSKSLEILGVSACRGGRFNPVPRLLRLQTDTGGAEEPFSRLRPNFSLCPRLTELCVELQHIGASPPNLINTLLISPVVLSRITFTIRRKVEPGDIILFVKTWAETDITIARFSTKLFRRNGGKRLLLTFRAIRALDFTPLIPFSIERGVEVAVERDGDEELAFSSCVSCEME